MGKWDMVRLGNLGEFKSGGTPSRKEKKYFNGDIPWITTTALGKLYIDENDAIEFITEEAVNASATKIVSPYSVMIGTRVGIGKVSINKVPMCTSQDIISIENIDDTKLFNKYLLYCIRSFDQFFETQKRGATIKGINGGVLKSLEIPLPPLETQKQIANTLDNVAELLALRKKQLEELEQLIKSVFYDMFGDPVTNEKGWEVRRLSKCCTINPKKSELVNVTDDLEVSFVSMSSVSDNGEINTRESRKLEDVKKGFTYFCENDVLFAKITPCMENGKGAVAKDLVNKIGFGSTEFHVLRPIERYSNSEWLFRLTSLSEFRRIAENNMSGSAGQKRVPASFFDKFRVPLPPLHLQIQFSEIVNKIEDQKTIVKQSIDESQHLFDSLMGQYFD